jgi:hypothetical protein
MKDLFNELNQKKEFLEVSFNDEYKNEQKKHKPLNPMILNSKLMNLITILPVERLGKKGKFFFDDTNENPKELTENILIKSKNTNMTLKKKEEKLKESYENIRESMIRKNKTMMPVSNNILSPKKVRKSVILTNPILNEGINNRKNNNNLSKNNQNKDSSFEMIDNKKNTVKKNENRRFSVMDNHLILERHIKKYKLNL